MDCPIIAPDNSVSTAFFLSLRLYLRTVLNGEPWASDFGYWLKPQPPAVRGDMAGAVEAYLHEAPTGRTRKYYHLTKKGAERLRTEEAAWRTYAGAVNAVLRHGAGLSPA